MQLTEVVARIGDTVIDVGYVRPRPSRRAVHALAALSVVALIGAAVLFVAGLGVATTNERAYAAFVRIHHAPAWAFRPIVGAAWRDALWFGALALGVTAAGFAVWQHQRANRFTPCELPRQDRSIVRYAVTAVVAPIEQPFAQPPVQRRTALYFGSSLVAHLLLVLILPALAEDTSVQPSRVAATYVATRNVAAATLDELDAAPPGAAGDGSVDAPTALALPSTDDGHAGHSPTVTEAREPQRSRDAYDPVGDAYLPGAALVASTSFAELMGEADLAAGFSDGASFAPWSGGQGRAEFGAARMQGDVAVDETWGTISAGSYGTISSCGCTSTLQRSHTFTTHCTLGVGTVTGGLDPSIIKRYLRRNLDAISYCYEKELLVDKALAGTVTVQFLIAPDGTVQAATGSGMPAIDACVATMIKRIEFPATASAAPVQVNYPLTFRPAARD